MHIILSKTILLYLVVASFAVVPLFAQTGEVLPKNSEERKSQEEIDAFKAQQREEKAQMIEEEKARLREQKEVMVQQREEVKEKRMVQRCENVTELVSQKVERYNTNREMYVGKYERLRERIAAWANRLEEDGYDVSNLEASLTTLDTKIANVSQLHESFVTKLDDLKNYECGNSDGAYKQALEVSREALTTVRDGVSEVRKYYIEEVKPLVIDLRNQVAADKESSESENN
jgi:hypothetical protein